MLNSVKHNADYVDNIIFASFKFNLIFYIMIFNYDFFGKRVRKSGVVLDKFSLCQEIHFISMTIFHDYYHDLTFNLYPEIYKYSDCVSRLKELIKLL